MGLDGEPVMVWESIEVNQLATILASLGRRIFYQGEEMRGKSIPLKRAAFTENLKIHHRMHKAHREN